MKSTNILPVMWSAPIVLLNHRLSQRIIPKTTEDIPIRIVIRVYCTVPAVGIFGTTTVSEETDALFVGLIVGLVVSGCPIANLIVGVGEGTFILGVIVGVGIFVGAGVLVGDLVGLIVAINAKVGDGNAPVIVGKV